MLAALIFATEDATDRRETLAETLPFGGTTLIEYQARLLASVGVTHLLVVAGRVTPALVAATNRISGRGLAVDTVRSADEAAAKAHPLAQLIVVADGLVTTDAVIEWIASNAQEAVLVSRDGDGAGGIERVDAGHSWAGLARVPARRLTEVAAMPADYDFQSALLRASSQAGAQQLLLPPLTGRTRHGIERSAAALLRRSKSVLAALGDRRTAWIDRFVFTPLTGFALPHLVARGVPGAAVIAAATLTGALMLALFWNGWSAAGLALGVVATATLSAGSMLSWLRGEDRAAKGQEAAIAAVAAVAVLALGYVARGQTGDGAPLALAVALVAAAGLAERVPTPRIRWRATPAAFPLILLPFALFGWPTLGLVGAATYAFATLGTAIEAVRQA